MATDKDIINYLLGGGSYESIKNKVSQGQLIATLLKNPQAVAKLQEMGTKKAAPLAKFDPMEVYGTGANTNAVELRYSTMDPKYKNLTDNWFSVVRSSGGNAAEVNAYKNSLTNAKFRAAKAAEFGLDENSFIQTVEQLDKDVKSFMSAETDRQKSNMSAFYKKREAAGITGVSEDVGNVADQYLTETTGVAGLAGIPSTIEALAKQKASKFAEKFKGTTTIQGKSVESLVKDFEQKFISGAKKKKINPLNYVASDLIKKNMLGK
jgi:hypothetical protein